jgi:hypothetical protein
MPYAEVIEGIERKVPAQQAGKTIKAIVPHQARE